MELSRELHHSLSLTQLPWDKNGSFQTMFTALYTTQDFSGTSYHRSPIAPELMPMAGHAEQDSEGHCTHCVLCACVPSCFSHVRFFGTLWTIARQASLSMGVLQARKLEWVAMPSSSGSYPLRDGTHGCCISHGGGFFTTEPSGKPMGFIHFSHSVVSDSLWLRGMLHTRLPCPSPTPRACSNACPLSRWCHPTISSSVIHFSSCI